MMNLLDDGPDDTASEAECLAVVPPMILN